MAPNSMMSFLRRRNSTNMADVDSPKEHAESGDFGLALLSFASGSIDALAFFNLDQVFPSAMTGNTALLGLALGQGHLIEASRPFIAFAGFVAGAAVASASVELWLHKFSISRAVCRLLALEACLLAAFALAWWFIDRPITGVGLYGLIVAASSGMGIQSVAARLVGRPGDHDRRVHQHADRHRDLGNRGHAAAAAQLAPRHQAADWHVSDLWRWRRNLRSARLACGVTRHRALCGRCHRGELPLARRTIEREWDMKSGIVGVDDLEGAGIVIIAAGINEKAGGALDHSVIGVRSS